jgi:hypothetical protein
VMMFLRAPKRAVEPAVAEGQQVRHAA